MKARLLALFAVLSLISMSGEALAAIDLKLFVDATLGVDVETEDNPIILTIGETGGTTLTIINEANIRDKIRLNGRVRQNNAPTDWVKLAFICGETAGECDDVPSSDTRTVDNVQLTPETDRTTVFVEMTGWRKYSSGSGLKLHIDGFSLTNNTVQANLKEIPIIINDQSGSSGPLASPELSNYSLLILMMTAALVAYFKKGVL